MHEARSSASEAPAAAPSWRGRAIAWLAAVIAAVALQLAFPCSVLSMASVTIVLAVGVPGVFVFRLAPLPRGRWSRAAALAVLALFTAAACGANLATHVCM